MLYGEEVVHGLNEGQFLQFGKRDGLPIVQGAFRPHIDAGLVL